MFNILKSVISLVDSLLSKRSKIIFFFKYSKEGDRTRITLLNEINSQFQRILHEIHKRPSPNTFTNLVYFPTIYSTFLQQILFLRQHQINYFYDYLEGSPNLDVKKLVYVVLFILLIIHNYKTTQFNYFFQ